MLYNLILSNQYPFSEAPAIVQLEGDKIYCNDVNFPKSIDPDASTNPYNVRLFVIGHEFGALCAVWASNDQEALDNACDFNLLDCLMDEEQDYDKQEENDLTAPGNASELFDLSNVWIGEVKFDPARDIQLIVQMVRCYENQKDTLEG